MNYKEFLSTRLGKFLAALLVILIIALIGNVATAATYQVTCDPPTSRVDGTPFDAATELDHYNWFIDGTLSGTSTACAFLLDRPDGSYMVTATTVDTANRESPESLGKSISLVTAAPNPPTLK